MVFQIRFKGMKARNGFVYREPYVIREWPEIEEKAALREWNKIFSRELEFYEFMHLAEGLTKEERSDGKSEKNSKY